MRPIEIKKGNLKQIVNVSDSFFELSKQEQDEGIAEIASTLKWESEDKESIQFEKELERKKQELRDQQMPAKIEQKGIKKAINIASKIAPYAGIAIKQTPWGRAVGAGITGGSRFIEGITQGEKKLDALKGAAKAAGIDLVTGGIGTALGKGIKLARKPISKGMSQMSGAPADSLEYLIENPNLVKGTNLEKVVKGARESLIKQRNKAIKLGDEQIKIVDKAQSALTTMDDKFIKNTVVDDTLKELNLMRGNTAKYSEQTKDEIKNILQLIQNDPSPAGRLEVLQKIDKELRKRGVYKSKYDKLKATQVNDTEKLLLDVSNKLRGEVGAIGKYRVGEIRDQMSKILDASDPLVGKFQVGKRAEGLFRTSKEQPIDLQEQLKVFSGILPKSEKFYKKGVALAGTDRISPKINLMDIRTVLAPAGYLAGGIPAAALIGGAQSPFLQRQLITKGKYIPRILGKALAQINTPIKRNPEGTYTEDSQKKLKQERGVQ
tara:strand:+ start:5556 stop:7031 length:1476 start_codon:yes stop_codon:yes gene_type:complete